MKHISNPIIHEYPGWEQFRQKEPSEKSECFRKQGRLFDIIHAQQFNRPFLDYICKLADTIRAIAKTKTGSQKLAELLCHKRAMLYFVQPSSRTFLSFMAACQILGLKTSEIRSVETSSEIKGETAEDAIRTFSSYVDLIIMRHPEAGFAERSAWILNQTERAIPVINGGSGPDQHPTQALLDVYTLERSGGIDGKKIAMIGDLKRGRTVRSLCYLMKNYKDVTLYFVSPDEFKIKDDIKVFLNKHGIKFYETGDMQSVLPKIDAIYMTRIQIEYGDPGSDRCDHYPQFCLKKEHLDLMAGHCVILHPLPRRHEIELGVDCDKRAIYWRQERNGMWIRAALIAHIFQVDAKLLNFDANVEYVFKKTVD